MTISDDIYFDVYVLRQIQMQVILMTS